MSSSSAFFIYSGEGRDRTGSSFHVVDLVFAGRMLLYENFVFG
ncbi:hypothetical protein HMPREF1705_04696 [Acetomicrobium hydrogeniformans ATCC BAA-1850]|uniref:Uncharacterized protein n=1 Tax=Acetomicrobium hydrogeniformans ATCC BAA-1850 TaxID=592015 RepID=A0A0T5XCJ4_9BACT|nr:hypothetical protein HMPREF1705_04696 [Acetomicrobium hydrogeniformans ATCC BAA-1850]